MKRLNMITVELMFSAAVLFIIALFSKNFSDASMPFLVFFMLYSIFGLMVLQNWRWAKWFSFLLSLVGGIVGMGLYLKAPATPNWITLTITLGIWITSWTAAVCLFVVLWRNHVPTIVVQDGQ